MRLDRVELGERRLVEGGILTERGDRERLQVEQLRVRRILLWQDEVAEGDRQRRLRHQPAVGHDANEVLRWEGVGDWHGEGDGVVILRELLLEDEDLVVPDRLLVRVLHDHVKRLGGAVHLRVELEVGRDCKLDTQHRVRVMGCTWAESSSRGNWWTKRWIILPILGKRTSSPISWGW